MGKQKLKGIYLITDTQGQDRYSHVELADAAYRAGVQMVQYRAKDRSDRKALEEIREIAGLKSKGDHLLIVNDRPDLAKMGGADGVHLGQDDLSVSVAARLLGEEAIIGGTSANLEEAKKVEEAGADYVALGHIFETSTKEKEYAPRGITTLHKVRQEIDLPLVAIGGIRLENAPQVIDAGADILAVSSAICRAEDPQQAARKLVELFE
ncbi:thiamine phosphate synthase [Fodinibius halophilus]|uniref:Thiamine-phosphate synthase n=1 Tax=Fodinibius halophilus TaxID=1736908 RepID=A0A6M1TJ20_9BACT|nr:thiamine phosphate synthase [Fodinibius halophilus]NGP88610.1 thiamine phosphate synthase [Fodinibius halophilus]